MDFVLLSAALGVGLAMDAFSVSLANGLHEPTMRLRRMCAIAGVYAAFQYAMPVIGWICVHTAAEHFQAFQRFIPWIALTLLLYIGGKMLLEGIRESRQDDVRIGTERAEGTGVTVEAAAGSSTGAVGGSTADASAAEKKPLGTGDLLVQGVATSIDALSVGFTIASYSAGRANLAALIIGGVTFFICLGGLAVGKQAGTRLSWKASVLGGCILILIGVRIFIGGV